MLNEKNLTKHLKKVEKFEKIVKSGFFKRPTFEENLIGKAWAEKIRRKKTIHCVSTDRCSSFLFNCKMKLAQHLNKNQLRSK